MTSPYNHLDKEFVIFVETQINKINSTLTKQQQSLINIDIISEKIERIGKNINDVERKIKVL